MTEQMLIPEIPISRENVEEVIRVIEVGLAHSSWSQVGDDTRNILALWVRERGFALGGFQEAEKSLGIEPSEEE